MIYSKGRNTSGGSRAQSPVRVIVVVFIIVAVVALAVIGLLGVFEAFPFGLNRRDSELVALWSRGDYLQVIASAEETLSDRPFNAQALTYGGFAHYYHGEGLVDAEEREQHIERAVILLRKAEHLSHAPLAAERDYVLAKAYFQKGRLFVDLAAEYMERSLSEGYEASDSRSYLGLAYAQMGQPERSAGWFADAIALTNDEQELDALRVKAAESLVDAGDYALAEEYLRSVMATSQDDYVRLVAANQLTGVLILNEELAEAEDLVETTLVGYPDSADAHYHLGVIYDLTDRPVEASYEWRQAVEIDPNHTDALRSLANRGE
jgi:tetratricopeptide (TPR) repeat protein